MQKTGRNDPCTCGSGKKFKKCCEMQAKPPKFRAEVIPAQPEQAQGINKLSSLFFRNAALPVKNSGSSEACAQTAQES